MLLLLPVTVHAGADIPAGMSDIPEVPSESPSGFSAALYAEISGSEAAQPGPVPELPNCKLHIMKLKWPHVLHGDGTMSLK